MTNVNGIETGAATRSAGIVGTAIGLLAGAAFVAPMIVGASMVFAPVAKRLAAPVACPEGYLRSIVVQDIGHPEPGVTTFSSELYCFKASGRPVQATDFRVFVGLWAIVTGSMVVVVLGAIAVGKAQSAVRAKR